MNRCLLTCMTSLATLAIGMAVPCDAQIVRFGGFGGVSVRAPFVAVDVWPYGATRVRAPFTSVYSYGPAYPYGPAVSYRRGIVGVPVPPLPPFAVVPTIPVYPIPVTPGVVFEDRSIPTEGYQVTRPSLDGHVSEDLRRAAIQLQYSLSLRHDGDVWLKYLDPARIVASIERGETPSSLRDLIINYDGVVANRSLRAIYTASGFNETRELLRVYVDMRSAQPKAAPPVADTSRGLTPAAPIDPTPSDQEELPAPIPAPLENGNDRQATPPPPPANPPGEPSAEPTDL